MHIGCKYFVMPENNSEFWKDKLIKNKKRDEDKILQLRTLGWKVIVIWECQLKGWAKDETLKILTEGIKGQNGL